MLLHEGWWTLAMSMALTFSAASLAALFPPGPWYAALAKPPWNPPSWVFGPVWTVLYVGIAVAGWLIWRRGGMGAQRVPLTLFCVQLALNAAWTPLFFGLRNLGLAFLEILLLWLAVTATLRAFSRVSRVAAYLLAPYLCWVTFAALLNFAVWQLNP